MRNGLAKGALRRWGLVAALGCALAGCGGGGGGGTSTSTADPTLVGGFVTFPNAPATKALLPGVGAAALEVASGGTVSLHRVTAEGTLVEPALATGTIDSTGRYSLSVPAGVALGSSLVVVASLDQFPGQTLRAQLTDTVVDVDPVSDFTVGQSLAAGLANVTPADVSVLRGFVDFAARTSFYEDAVDPAAACAALCDQYAEGEALNEALTEVRQDVQAPAASSPPPGTLYWAEFNANGSNSGEGRIGGTRGLETFTAGTTPGVAVARHFGTEAKAVYSYADYEPLGPHYTNWQTPVESDLTFDAEGVPTYLEADGGFTFVNPLCEALNPPDPSGVFHSGWREISAPYRFRPLGHGAWATVNHFMGWIYGTTKNDSGADALDLTNLLGRSVNFGLSVHVTQGALARDTLAGPAEDPVRYGAVTLGSHFDRTGTRWIQSTVDQHEAVRAAAADQVTFRYSKDRIRLQRTFTPGTGLVTAEWTAPPAPPSGVPVPVVEADEATATLNPATGMLTFGASEDVQFSADGALFTYMHDAREGSAPPEWAEFEWAFGVRLPTSTPSVLFPVGRRYRIVLFQVGFDEAGGSHIRQSTQLWATVDIAPGGLHVTGVAATASQSGDVQTPTLKPTLGTNVAPHAGTSTSFVLDGTTPGKFDWTFDVGGVQHTACGFFNAEGLGVARVWDSTNLGAVQDGGRAFLGVALFIPVAAE